MIQLYIFSFLSSLPLLSVHAQHLFKKYLAFFIPVQTPVLIDTPRGDMSTQKLLQTNEFFYGTVYDILFPDPFIYTQPYLDCIKILTKYIVSLDLRFIPTDQSVTNKRKAYTLFRARLYDYIKTGMASTHGDVFDQIVKIWLEYLVPWGCTDDEFLEGFVGRYRLSDDWKGFVMENFFHYTSLLTTFMKTTEKLTVPFLKSSYKHVSLIETVLRVFVSTEGLVDELCGLEKVFLEGFLDIGIFHLIF